MGTNFYFDAMLPGIKEEVKNQPHDPKKLKRQVEVFTYSNGLFLRVGPLGTENSGEDTYTVELSKENGAELRDSLQRAMHYLAWER